MLGRSLFIWAIALVLILAGCGGSVSQDANSLDNGPDRQSRATEANPFVTELIAGAGGHVNGGWPDHGTDVGQVSVWNDGTNIYVKYETQGDFYFGGDDGDDNLHLWVGEDASGLPGVAPGQFPWSAEVLANGTEYLFTIPLSGNYPAGGYMDGAAYDFGAGDTVEIMAHGVTCHVEDGSGGGGGQPDQGVFAVLGLYYGKTDVYVGDVTFAMDGWDLVVTVGPLADWYIQETQLYVGFTPPPFAPGSWPYQHSPLPDYTDSDEYRVSLFDIGADCGDLLLIALHATLYQVIVDGEYGWYDEDGEFQGAESSTAWNPDCREPLVNPNSGKPHDWKSYCSITIPQCVPGEPGDEICETAWGFDLDGNLLNGDGSMIGNGISRDEDGWFPNYFGFPRWGWVFTYDVE